MVVWSLRSQASLLPHGAGGWRSVFVGETGEGQSILCTKAESGVGGLNQYQPVLL